MKIIVTGGSGFIGSNVADAYLKEGHQVVIVDNLSRPNVVKNLMWLIGRHKRLKFLQYDVKDSHKVSHALEGADVVFHFAAQTAVTTSVIEPRDDFETNVIGTFNVLEAIRNSEKKPHLIFASTNKVYGDFETDKPINENQPLQFSTPYGCSKGAADQYVLDYGKMYEIPTTVLRMSCIYGNRQFGSSDQGWLAHFMISKAKEKPVIIYGDGSQVRDALYIDDYVELCKRLVQTHTIGVFNIGGGIDNTISVLEAVKRIGNDYTFEDWRPADQKYYVSDISKISFLWQPEIGIEEGFLKLRSWAENQK